MDERDFNDLLKEIQKKNKDALEQFYEKYIGFIKYAISKITHNNEDIEDIAVEVVLKFWTGKIKSTYVKYPSSWLYQISINQAKDYLKSRHDTIGLERIEEVEDDSIDMESSLNFEMQLRKLSEQETLLINLRFVDRYGFQEIADLLHKPIGTTVWRYNRAIKKLKNFYKKPKK